MIERVEIPVQTWLKHVLANCRDNRDSYLGAFLHNNWVGAAVFAGIVLGVAMR